MKIETLPEEYSIPIFISIPIAHNKEKSHNMICCDLTGQAIEPAQPIHRFKNYFCGY